MKSFNLEFHTLALKEWQKLDNSVKEQFKKHLQKRLANPRILSAKLHGDLDNFYKIKLRTVGYRLVYEVIDHKLVVLVMPWASATKRLCIEKLKAENNR